MSGPTGNGRDLEPAEHEQVCLCARAQATVVGVFERYESARHAADLLAESGFGPDAVQVTQQTTNDANLRTLVHLLESSHACGAHGALVESPR